MTQRAGSCRSRADSAADRSGKVQHEHIYWDQATVLVQAGLLDPGALPVTGAAQADALLDQDMPKNELLG